MDHEALQNHLKTEHGKTPLTDNLKEIVYGGIDGIITTFAVVAGFTGAMTMDSAMAIPTTVVLLFGLANLFADGFSMGVSDFLSSRAEKKLFEKDHAKESYEIRTNEQYEYDESVDILMDHGFGKDDARQLADIYKKNPKFWADFMMRYELQQPRPDEKPSRGALVTFLSFVVFGLIPLLPYIFGVNSSNQFLVACIAGAFALAILGFFRARITQERSYISVLEIVGLGSVAGGIAFFVGTLFQ